MKRLLLASGGFDSTFLLYNIKPEGALFFNYNQNDRQVAYDILFNHCKKLSIPLYTLYLSFKQQENIFCGYKEQIFDRTKSFKQNFKDLWIEGRNLILFHNAVCFSLENNFDEIITGIGDTLTSNMNHIIEDDTSPEFTSLFNQCQLYTYSKVIPITNPLCGKDRVELMKIAIREYNLDLEKDIHYCLYEISCGKCIKCVLHHEDLKKAYSNE